MSRHLFSPVIDAPDDAVVTPDDELARLTGTENSMSMVAPVDGHDKMVSLAATSMVAAGYQTTGERSVGEILRYAQFEINNAFIFGDSRMEARVVHGMA